MTSLKGGIMPRRLYDLKGLLASDRFPWDRAGQIYKLVRRPDPMPHRKIGKLLYFDEETILKWFDRQAGHDGDWL
jgi:hypothetical protein